MRGAGRAHQTRAPEVKNPAAPEVLCATSSTGLPLMPASIYCHVGARLAPNILWAKDGRRLVQHHLCRDLEEATKRWPLVLLSVVSRNVPRAFLNERRDNRRLFKTRLSQ